MVSDRSGRRGFTLIQLLIILAIIAMLLAMLVPAVYQVGQVSKRTMSLNNLKQLGLASHGFHDIGNQFPPALGKVAGVEGTTHFFLLPYLEQNQVFQLGKTGPWDNNAYSRVIPIFVDKEDASAPPGNQFKGWLATTNYPANWLAFKDGNKITDFTDGTSNTFLFAQRYQVCAGNPCAWGYTDKYYWAPIFAYFSQAKFQSAPGQGDCDPALAQSVGSASIQICFADGSVRLVAPGVSSRMWWYGCDPADGNPVDFEE